MFNVYVSLMAWQLSIAEEAMQLAGTDFLTGIANRSKLEATYAFAMASAMRTGVDICFILLDLNGLKLINDKQGHQAGDDAIIAMSKAISLACKRESDLPTRLAGDEFAILTVGMNEIQIKALIASLELELNQLDDSLSFSYGYCICRPGCSYEFAYLIADEAMYKNKRGKYAAEARIAEAIGAK